MDVRAIGFEQAGLRLEACRPFEVAVPMTLDAYVAYAMSESVVELAVGAGIAEADIKSWCESTLAGILDEKPRDVQFDSYVAYVRRRRPAASSSSSSRA